MPITWTLNALSKRCWNNLYAKKIGMATKLGSRSLRIWYIDTLISIKFRASNILLHGNMFWSLYLQRWDLKLYNLWAVSSYHVHRVYVNYYTWKSSDDQKSLWVQASGFTIQSKLSPIEIHSFIDKLHQQGFVRDNLKLFIHKMLVQFSSFSKTRGPFSFWSQGVISCY